MIQKDFQHLKAPAIAVLISGTFSLFFAILAILGGLGRLLLRIEELPSDEAERAGFLIGTAFGYGAALISLIASPFIIYGALKMMNAERYRAAVAAAVLSVIPLTSCCFVAGVPAGLWALAVLYRRESREIFSGTRTEPFGPPVPPGFED